MGGGMQQNTVLTEGERESRIKEIREIIEKKYEAGMTSEVTTSQYSVSVARGEEPEVFSFTRKGAGGGGVFIKIGSYNSVNGFRWNRESSRRVRLNPAETDHHIKWFLDWLRKQ